jgi:hypothetical protein
MKTLSAIPIRTQGPDTGVFKNKANCEEPFRAGRVHPQAVKDLSLAGHKTAIPEKVAALDEAAPSPRLTVEPFFAAIAVGDPGSGDLPWYEPSSS